MHFYNQVPQQQHQSGGHARRAPEGFFIYQFEFLQSTMLGNIACARWYVFKRTCFSPPFFLLKS